MMVIFSSLLIVNDFLLLTRSLFYWTYFSIVVFDLSTTNNDFTQYKSYMPRPR